MLLKNHLIKVFKQASLENNFLLKENVVLKWVHRFGIDSLNDLLIHSPLQKENQERISLTNEVHEENQEQISLTNEVHEENQEQISLTDGVQKENQEQISLIDGVQKENQEQISLTDGVQKENQEQISLNDEVHKNQEQIKLELSKNFENIEETRWESNDLESTRRNKISSKNQYSNKIDHHTKTPKLPLPYIKNLRKWINNDKKAS